ncbi:hypothetical protein CPLU01_13693 [Colletotrichum plurivorum]|uniref:Uncharacterized protein n=1 Tax=Colletotrichum plurivorum TaxID=2175906 RepID=A0A8H6JQ90_9PEZI|nr:hypothetical protein CPLU01_13693 [Colletotrichum plurivorum]
MSNIENNSTYQIFLRDLKARVPHEDATPAQVRLWLLQLLKNRKVDLADGPNAFACSWGGAELHTLHPNHFFGFFTSHGVSSQTAHMIVGDVMECLEDYRTRRSTSLSAGQPWPPAEETETESVRITVGDETTPLLGESEPSEATGSLWTRTRYVFIGSFMLLVCGLAILAWWILENH